MWHSGRRFVSRRAVLASAALLGAGGLLPRLAHAEDESRRIGLGFSLYGMKSLTVADGLKQCAAIGYDCVELPVMADWPANSARLDRAARREIRQQLAEHGLRLSALMENLPMLPADEARNREHLDRLKLAVELARDLASSMTDTDARHVPLVETILGGKPGEFDKVKAQLVEQLRAWAKVAADAGVVVAVKAHFGNATQRPEQLLSLLDAVNSPWLKAAYDYSHFQLQDLDLAETMDALLPRARSSTSKTRTGPTASGGSCCRAKARSTM
jgi:sugar phosphate isomerase/epimerase